MPFPQCLLTLMLLKFQFQEGVQAAVGCAFPKKSLGEENEEISNNFANVHVVSCNG